MWHDPAIDEPRSLYPAGAEVTLVAGFWTPWDQGGQWWYWVALNEFRGWVAARDITDVQPSAVPDPPPGPYVAYDWTSVAPGGSVALRATPDANGETLAELEAGTAVQVTGIGWEAATGQWWYYVETNTAADGWVLPDALNWEDVTPG